MCSLAKYHFPQIRYVLMMMMIVFKVYLGNDGKVEQICLCERPKALQQGPTGPELARHASLCVGLPDGKTKTAAKIFKAVYQLLQS